MTVQRLLLVRHGETDPNAAGRYVSSSDPDLSDNGRKQVESLAHDLAGMRIDSIWSSPKTRALRTAEAIVGAQTSSPEVLVDERLRELGFGAFEGMTAAELETAGQLSVFRAWRQGIPTQYPDGAETFESAATRLGSLFDEVVGLDLDTVVVVGHSHALRILLADRVLAAPPEAHRRLRMDHARVAEIQWEDGVPRIVTLNGSSTA